MKDLKAKRKKRRGKGGAKDAEIEKMYYSVGFFPARVVTKVSYLEPDPELGFTMRRVAFTNSALRVTEAEDIIFSAPSGNSHTYSEVSIPDRL